MNNIELWDYHRGDCRPNRVKRVSILNSSSIVTGLHPLFLVLALRNIWLVFIEFVLGLGAILYAGRATHGFDFSWFASK
jgi:hypothetical protein